jgi:hypothetical protein
VRAAAAVLLVTAGLVTVGAAIAALQHHPTGRTAAAGVVGIMLAAAGARVARARTSRGRHAA